MLLTKLHNKLKSAPWHIIKEDKGDSYVTNCGQRYSASYAYVSTCTVHNEVCSKCVGAVDE